MADSSTPVGRIDGCKKLERHQPDKIEKGKDE